LIIVAFNKYWSLESRKREKLVQESDFKNALDMFGVDAGPKKVILRGFSLFFSKSRIIIPR